MPAGAGRGTHATAWLVLVYQLPAKASTLKQLNARHRSVREHDMPGGVLSARQHRAGTAPRPRRADAYPWPVEPGRPHHDPPEDLTALYVRAGLSADEAGSVFGVSRRIVLRSAHDQGLPVRVGGPPPARGPSQIELLTGRPASGIKLRPAGGRSPFMRRWREGAT